jgi:asparagine synthase (glutamine-hydrolysing)
MATAPLANRYSMYLSVFKDDERRAVYSPKFQALLAPSTVEEGGSLATPEALPADWMMSHDQLNYLPDCLMVKTDVASMANSVELRSPFLDHKFIQMAARIPSSFKRRGRRGKIILKEAAQELLPDDVLNKPKTGFGVPLASWFRNQLRGMLHETLLDDRTMRRGLFNPTFIRRLVDEHVAGRRDWSNRLWALLVLELWFREFID